MPDTRHFAPEALDRLDYFTAQLKRNGIYANLCLLNYRQFTAADGLPKEIEQLNGTEHQDQHVVGFFDSQMLELQREYARNLLSHHNPYLNATYAEDPAVAIVEINNENGLIHAWLWEKVEAIPDVFLAGLKGQWNEWLRKRYGTTDRLRSAWGGKDEPLGDELLINADLSRGLDGWRFVCHGRAAATATVIEDAPEALRGGRSLRLAIVRPGEFDWHVRFEQRDIRLDSERPYVLTLWAKADKTCKIKLNLGKFGRSLNLTPQRTHQRLVTRLDESAAAATLNFVPPAESGVYWLAGLTPSSRHRSRLGKCRTARR